MKSRTVTTMIMMMVVLLVVPLLNVGGHDLVTADVPTTTPPATTTASPASQPHPPTTPTSQPHPPTTPTSQPHPPTTPATMNATATPARTQTTGPEKVVSISCTTSTKGDATALSIDRHHYGISVAALLLTIFHLAFHLGILIFADVYQLRFRGKKD
ncbi:UV excision repair protein RAD23 homolog isoform X1 [Sycon ciliatum]|uniref:UV excision repair protein RAD23 homolog isoform X1 n=1 Tax=Sycon ciliatum TaxID=27933 RepID=UPI0031F6C9C9